MLTKKQYDLLIFIDQRLRDTGISPSFEEMKEALQLKSKSGIHRLITGLEERGFLRRLAHRARALEVIRLPENMGAGVSLPTRAPYTRRMARGRSVPSLFHRGEFRLAGINTQARPRGASVELPLWGKIAAGTPIEALRDNTEFVEIPASLLGAGEHYALEVEGDSMIEAGIHDGDVVVVRYAENAENGTIVVALVNNEEVTLKRMRRKGHAVALEPANKDYEVRVFGPDQVRVQGTLVGLIRKY
ncbi:MAG: transcriptional repressor LexA [Magnetospirillum sp. WYHS-4]